MKRLRTTITAAGVAALVAIGGVGASTSAEAGTPRYMAGAEGVGDPYFPYSGNGGYDVAHYDLDIDYTPPAPSPAPIEGQMSGVATIDIVATQDLDRFNLDLRGMTVSALSVNGKSAVGIPVPAAGTEVDGAAYWQLQDDAARIWELVVQPRPKIKAGETFQVVVEYGGTTVRPLDIEGALYGWVTTRDGAMVVSEPDGSMTWYPVSDHQTDKATYSFEITVPDGKVAVANGAVAGSRHGRRAHDLVLGRARRAGQLSHDGVGRRLRVEGDLLLDERRPDHRRRRHQALGVSTRHDERESGMARPDDRPVRGAVRALPVQLVRSDRRQRARDADASGVLELGK